MESKVILCVEGGGKRQMKERKKRKKLFFDKTSTGKRGETDKRFQK